MKKVQGVNIASFEPPKLGFWTTPKEMPKKKNPTTRTLAKSRRPATARTAATARAAPTTPPAPRPVVIPQVTIQAAPASSLSRVQPQVVTAVSVPPEPTPSNSPEPVSDEFQQQKLSELELKLNRLEQRAYKLELLTREHTKQVGQILVDAQKSDSQTSAAMTVYATALQDVTCYLHANSKKPYDHVIQKGERVLLIYPYADVDGGLWVKTRQVFENGSLVELWVPFFVKQTRTTNFGDFRLTS
uniref:Uncharacterized protein n=1 Tax=viral metagenome TaxID=1070528 RepID=A0A6C0BND7_9ZZZZ